MLCLPCTLRAFSSLNGRERGSSAQQAATHPVCRAVHQQKQPRSGNQMGIQQERSASCSAVCAHQSSRSLQRFPLSAFFFFSVFFNSPVFAAGVSQKGCLETAARRCYAAESHGENPSLLDRSPDVLHLALLLSSSEQRCWQSCRRLRTTAKKLAGAALWICLPHRHGAHGWCTAPCGCCHIPQVSLPNPFPEHRSLPSRPCS